MNSNNFIQFPLSDIKGIGPQTAEKLARLGIYRLQDLLFHLPLRYEDRTHIVPLRKIRSGQQLAVEGTVEMAEVQLKGRRSLLCYIQDGTGFLTLRFFYFNIAQQKRLARGIRLRCFGEVRYGKNGYEMIHPEYRQINPMQPPPMEQSLTPVYPTTEKLHQSVLRKLISQSLLRLETENIKELLPDEILNRFHFPSLKEALQFLHQPPTETPIELLSTGKNPYRLRLAFEELLTHHLSLRQLRHQTKQLHAIILPTQGNLIQSFLQQLPFSLTTAQKQVFKDIKLDLAQPHPMMRLIQGDVGSGKTVVAALAALTAVENHYQVAIMVPTELLAEQHLKNFQTWFSPLNISVVGLTGHTKGKARENILQQLINGKAQVIIGTHALFQENVKFDCLSLVIIDEQHRFGVHQRLLLREKGRGKGNIHPHQLVMTATPIPRTLAMAAYADLDCSTIDELPPGRIPVKTAAINNEKRSEIIEHMRALCLNKKQAYWVCTLIEESEVLQCQTAEDTAEKLKKALPELHIGLIHGRMKSKEKDQIMSDFKSGQYDILVATTVIEVGVDVPRANLMIIENAERLGLSQLHQLRGRIGRNQIESHCILLYQQPLSQLARQRIDIMRHHYDGFVIAQKDLELRGPGEVLGTRQTGMISMKISDLIRDKSLLPDIYQAASLLLQKYPENIPLLTQRWITLEGKYGNV